MIGELLTTYRIVRIAQPYCPDADKADRYLFTLGTAWHDFHPEINKAKIFTSYGDAWNMLQRIYSANKSSLSAYSYLIQVRFSTSSDRDINNEEPDLLPSLGRNR